MLQGLYLDFDLLVKGDLLKYFSFLNLKLETMLFNTLYFNCISIFFWFAIHIVWKNIQLYKMCMNNKFATKYQISYKTICPNSKELEIFWSC